MQSSLWFHALSEDVRFRTFRLLAQSPRPLCLPELADILLKPAYTLSRALTELSKVGLVEEHKKGRLVFGTLRDSPAVRALADWFIQFSSLGGNPLEKNDDGSSRPGSDPGEYDFERLDWRLKMREEDRVVLTYGHTPERAVPRVLFVCVHNSARSQLAEEYLRKFLGDKVFVESAGLEPGILNPMVINLLASRGIDIAAKKTQGVGRLFREGRTYDWVITVCDRRTEKNCPVFPGPVLRKNWPFEDPSGYTGAKHEVEKKVESLASAMEMRIREFIQEDLKMEIV